MAHPCDECEYRRFLSRRLGIHIDQDTCHVQECPYEFEKIRKEHDDDTAREDT